MLCYVLSVCLSVPADVKSIDRMFMKILSLIYLWFLLNFGSHLDPDSGFGVWIRTGFALAEVCALRIISL